MAVLLLISPHLHFGIENSEDSIPYSVELLEPAIDMYIRYHIRRLVHLNQLVAGAPDSAVEAGRTFRRRGTFPFLMWGRCRSMP